MPSFCSQFVPTNSSSAETLLIRSRIVGFVGGTRSGEVGAGTLTRAAIGGAAGARTGADGAACEVVGTADGVEVGGGRSGGVDGAGGTGLGCTCGACGFGASCTGSRFVCFVFCSGVGSVAGR